MWVRFSLTLLFLCGVAQSLWAQSFKPVVENGQVYLDTAINEKGFVLERSGFAPYRAKAGQIEGQVYTRSLSTEVALSNTGWSLYSSLTLNLDKKFESFLATVGRDDNEHFLGPGYVYFEVWADGKRIWKSQAVRSSLTTVIAGPSTSKRKASTPVEIDVKGVRQLRLLTRYAAEFSQEARRVHRGSGCVWGDARLLPVAGAFGDTPTVQAPSLTISHQPLKLALQSGLVRLVASLPEETFGGRPLRAVVTPLRVGKNAVEGEDAIRLFVAAELERPLREGRILFKSLPPKEAESLVNALPASSALRTNNEAIGVLARGTGVDVVLLGAVEELNGSWHIVLRLFDARTNTFIGQVGEPVMPLPAPEVSPQKKQGFITKAAHEENHKTAAPRH